MASIPLLFFGIKDVSRTSHEYKSDISHSDAAPSACLTLKITMKQLGEAIYHDKDFIVAILGVLASKMSNITYY